MRGLGPNAVTVSDGILYGVTANGDSSSKRQRSLCSLSQPGSGKAALELPLRARANKRSLTQACEISTTA